MGLHLSRRQKSTILMVVDSVFILISAFLAHYIVESYIRPSTGFYYVMIGVCILSYLILGFRYHIFTRIIRYTSVYEVIKSTKFLTYSFTFSALLTVIFIQAVSFRYIFLMYMFCLVLIPGSRMLWRIYHGYQVSKKNGKSPQVDKIRTLLVGAGDGGNLFISNLLQNSGEIQLIGIVDRDKSKHHCLLYDIPILGYEEDIPQIVKKYEIDQVTIAIPSIKADELEKLLEYCNVANVPVNQMPSIEDILKGKISVSRFREIDVVDLLGREEVRLDNKMIAQQLEGKVVLVSGAGGSIGSEICRQVAKFEPKTLVLLGHGENSIYHIDKELRNLYGRTIEIIPVIADVQDRSRISKLMNQFKPHYVYHAAAHKHVPLMEYNPTEAVKNNVFGSLNMAEAAKEAGVKNFIMISTDKAVRPTNVMGSTKRVAEMLVTSLNEEGCTNFAAVRFGNVLGSRGSVVPVFKEQIEKGGPVTITDHRMIRYFMTIPEASRLVIQAGVLAQGGEIFILDMGEPVKIIDLAKKMIKLSGYMEGEIAIVEAGIRPGEKLYEELLIEGQLAENQIFKKIFIGNCTPYKREDVLNFVFSLKDMSDENLKEQLIRFANEHV